MVIFKGIMNHSLSTLYYKVIKYGRGDEIQLSPKGFMIYLIMPDCI